MNKKIRVGKTIMIKAVVTAPKPSHYVYTQEVHDKKLSPSDCDGCGGNFRIDERVAVILTKSRGVVIFCEACQEKYSG